MHTTLVRYHTWFAVSTCCACFAKHIMMMYRQFSWIWYVSQYGLKSVYFVGGRTLFPITKSFMGCPLPLSFPLTPLRPLLMYVSGNEDWTLRKSNIEAQGNGFQLNNFRFAQGNFCDAVNIGFGWFVNFCWVRWRLVWIIYHAQILVSKDVKLALGSSYRYKSKCSEHGFSKRNHSASSRSIPMMSFRVL